MAAAMIGIVEQDDVARPNISETLFDGQGSPRQCADMHGDVVSLRDQAAPCVADREREIPAGVEDLGIGRAKHGFAHLLHDRAQPVLDDGSRDRVDRDGHGFPV